MKLLFAFVLCFATMFIYAQDVRDVYKYSFLETGGTARAIGGGGALGALGGDFSSFSVNPAGIGASIMNEFSFTPNLYWNWNVGEYGGNKENDHKISMKLSQLGLVLTDVDVERSWKVFALGVGFNQLKNYSNDFTFKGTDQGTIGRRLEERANANYASGGTLNTFYDALAADIRLITDDNNDGQFLYRIDPNDAVLYKEQYVKTNGFYIEPQITVGANYENKWYLGAALGIPVVEKEEERFYSEHDREDAYPDFFSARFQERNDVSGAGFNLKLGAIYRYKPTLRFGLSVQSPSYIFMKDEIYTTLWGNVGSIQGDTLNFEPQNLALSPISEFKYTTKTAPKATASVAYIVKKLGFISADVDYVHYPAMGYIFKDDDGLNEDDFNDEIGDLYKSNINARLSAEAILSTPVRARLGFEYSGSPFKSGASGVGDLYFGNIGVSFRAQYVYLDVGYRFNFSKDDYLPATIGNADEFTVEKTTIGNQLVATVGVRF